MEPRSSRPQPRPPAAPHPEVLAAAQPRVIVVGWDGADWALLDPLLEAGRLPHLKSLLEKGAQARLETYRPRASPLLWTTIATGLTPPEHGVVDFQEFDVATRLLAARLGPLAHGPRDLERGVGEGPDVRRRGLVGDVAGGGGQGLLRLATAPRRSSSTPRPSRSPRGSRGRPSSPRASASSAGAKGAPRYEDVAKFLHVSRAEFDAAVAAGQRPRRRHHGIPEDPRLHARLREDGARPLRQEPSRPPHGVFRGHGRDRPRPREVQPAAPSGRRPRRVREIQGRRGALLRRVRPDPRRARRARGEGRRDAPPRLGPRLQVGRGPPDPHLLRQGRDGVPLARAMGHLRPLRARCRSLEGTPDRERVRRRADPLPSPRPSARRAHEGPRSRRPALEERSAREERRRLGQGVQGRARRRSRAISPPRRRRARSSRRSSSRWATFPDPRPRRPPPPAGRARYG